MSLGPTEAVWLLHLGSTLFLTGLIWTIQIVHYPLLAHTGRVEFVRYEHLHCERISWLVGPFMTLEALSAALLLRWQPYGLPSWPFWTGAALLLVVWVSTALVQVPCHNTLAAGFDAPAHRRLVRSNWIRTAAWTLRASLFLWCTGMLLPS